MVVTFLPSKCLFHVNFMLQKGLQNYSKFITVFCQRLLFLLRSASSSVNWSTPSPRQSLTRVSISKNLEKKWLNNFSLARENGIFSSLSCLDFQDVEKKILFLFSIYEIFQTILFLFSIFKIFKKNSLSFLDLWDSETRFSFSSRIFKILRKKSLSLLV